MTDIVEGPALAALSCGKPAFLVVMLHGEGADGQTMVDHALNWAPTMPKAEFLAAEAPASVDGVKRWFDGGDPEGLAKGLAALERFLEAALAKRRLPASHLALVGFSQGATLALLAGVARPGPAAAVVVFSGGPYGAPSVGADGAPPILLIHGDADVVSPLAAARETKAALTGQGAKVWSMTRKGLDHAMDDDGVIAAGDFLTEHVVHKKGAAQDDHDHDHDDHDHAH
ncbi:phospholipase [Methylosinus sporium]|uniref:Phospholipase n=1 Tax=Methylosinus sporium TaxID=428 RepID=A0A549T8Z4_METSR|nr:MULTISPECIES: dienelactone hydrolase family protein [Methylosinus]MBU3887702.1 dienelactone hydrolase family protein [Methylosinus sp. KRF6]TRL38330.1 phospholipase [Methylosinus sporium]